MNEPWQCPACRIWLAPGVAAHSCDDDAPAWEDEEAGASALPSGAASLNGNAAAQEVLGSKVQGLAPKSKSVGTGYPEEFEVFWSLYPLKRDKRKALKAWRSATMRQTQEVINAGASSYFNDVNRVAQFTKYAEGWLNADGWEDEPLPARIVTAVELQQRRESEVEADRKSRIAEAVAMAESTRGQA